MSSRSNHLNIGNHAPSCSKRLFAACTTGLVIATSFLAIPKVQAADPSYVFYLTSGGEKPLCTHMHKVFNKYFQHLWADPVITESLDNIFSASSSYAFPLLPGTPHDTRATFEMRYSKAPLSPEFDEIKWQEGHAKGIPINGMPGSFYFPPYLIAYVDIDNDGIIDTVVKGQFTKGYSWMLSQGESWAGRSEVLLTFRSRKVENLDPNTSGGFFQPPGDAGRALSLNGDYVRLFTFEGKTYVASYTLGFGNRLSKHTRENRAKDIPPHETMKIIALAEVAPSAIVERSEWAARVLCNFDMSQQK